MDGYLSGYEKSEDAYDTKYFTGIGAGTIDDIKNHPEKYALFWVDMHFENTTDHYIFDLNANLAKSYSNVWFSDPFTGGGYPEFPFDLSEHEASDWGFHIIVKTENMNEDEIDKLIRNIGITIHARSTRWPIFASNTICFKE